MGLGSTARKLQGLTDTAEDLYRKLTEVLERVRDIESSIEETNDRVDGIDRRLADQRALLEAIAEANGVDPATVPEADPADIDGSDGPRDEADPSDGDRDDAAAAETGEGKN